MTNKQTYGFQTGKPVTGDQLIGRDLILDQIEKLVLSGQSVVLIAPRRFGKSSILLEILWSELTKSRENIEVLLALSKEETTIYSSLDVKKINVARVLNRLINRGLVIKEGKQYSLTDPLFKYWIKRTILGMNKTGCV